MAKRKKAIFLLVALLSVAMLFSLTSCAEREVRDPALEGKYGGVLNFALGSAPPTLDAHKSTGAAEQTRNIGEHIYEYLVDWDSNRDLQPGLADNWSASEDGLVYTFELREGVLFHNLEEMTAEDVVASVQRIIDARVQLPLFRDIVETVEAAGTYTVEFHLKHPFEDFPHLLGPGAFVAIYPKELIDKYGTDTIPDSEIIGTGPYKIKDIALDVLYHFERFDEYVAREEEPDGWSGKKHAFLDEIKIHIVPDQMSRTLGVETGDYHYGQGIEYGDYERILNRGGVYPVPVIFANIGAVVNCAKPPFDNVQIRLAAQAALDAAEIMEAMYVYPDLYRLTSAYQVPEEVEAWYTEVGADYYNQGDPGLAAQMLEEAGYDGTPLVIISPTEFEFYKTGTLVMAEHLKEAGFEVDVRFSDMPTWIAGYINPGAYHLATAVASHRFMTPMPEWASERYPGWWSLEDNRHRILADKVLKEMDYEKRFEAWDKLVLARYETAAWMQFGQACSVSIASDKLVDEWNILHTMPLPRFWNAWLNE